MANSILLGRHHFLNVAIRRVPALQSLVWLRQGWDDFRQIKGASLAHGALITALGGVLLMLGSSHPYLVAAAISGYLLVGPIMTTGLCELSRRRAGGEPTGFDESLLGMMRNPEGLIYFGLVLAIVAGAWFVLSGVVLQSAMHASAGLPDAGQLRCLPELLGHDLNFFVFRPQLGHGRLQVLLTFPDCLLGSLSLGNIANDAHEYSFVSKSGFGHG